MYRLEKINACKYDAVFLVGYVALRTNDINKAYRELNCFDITVDHTGEKCGCKYEVFEE